MEDPRRQIVEVVQGLIGRPTLKQQAEVLKRFYAPDARFHHYLVDVAGGVDDIISIYQMAHVCFNYQAVMVRKVLYDDSANHMALQVTIYSRPWISLGREVAYELLIRVELEDWPQQDGKVLKRIKLQHDYFERDQLLQIIPVFGTLYGSNKIRFFLGRLEALLFQSLRYMFDFFLPSNIKHGLLGLWVHSQAQNETVDYEKYG